VDLGDPFDQSRYNKSLISKDSVLINPFVFADFTEHFSQIASEIKMRQMAASLGYTVPVDSFLNTDNWEATTPNGISAGIDLFKDALIQLVQGDLVEQYGKVPGCNVYVGFFHFASNGLPVLGESSIAPNGKFSDTPDIENVSDILEFAKAAGTNLNEFVFAMNVLNFTHGKMLFQYTFNDSCT